MKPTSKHCNPNYYWQMTPERRITLFIYKTCFSHKSESKLHEVRLFFFKKKKVFPTSLVLGWNTKWKSLPNFSSGKYQTQYANDDQFAKKQELDIIYQTETKTVS